MNRVSNLFYMMSFFLFLCSCATRKAIPADYYTDPSGIEKKNESALRETKRETRQVDILASEATDKLRAVGIGNDYDEKYARREAIRDAQATLAGYLQRAVLEIAKEYHQKKGVNQKKISEQTLKDYLETFISQKVSSVPVGLPEVYDLSDGSVKVYVCVELRTNTAEVLGETFDALKEKEILGVEYDKQQFIEENLDVIERLRNELIQ